MRRRGFTLIELLVVVGLIAILGTLLIVAIGKMQTSGKRQQTHGTMQNLQNMFAEYDVNRRVPFGLGNRSFSALSTANQGILLNALAMPCPQSVISDGGAYRFGASVQFTRAFLAQMMQSPSMASAIGKLPSSSLMTFVGNPFLPNPLPTWDYTVAYNIYAPVGVTDTSVSPSVTYAYYRTQIYFDSTGDQLQDGQRDYGLSPDASFTTNAPPNYYFWMPITIPPTGSMIPLPTPVILDAWGNPIIFVAGGVLGAPATAASGQLLAGGQPAAQVHSPDFHPFFASAGPDGDFSKGDDNLYSFEK